jgi:hypothetical protein
MDDIQNSLVENELTMLMGRNKVKRWRNKIDAEFKSLNNAYRL